MVEARSSTVNLAAFRESTIPQARIPSVRPPVLARWLRERSRILPPWRHLSMRLMPPRCLFCGQAGDLGAVDLCEDCLGALPWLESAENESIRSESRSIDSISVLIPLRYAPPVDAALRDLKFRGELAPARVFGAVLAASAALRGPLPDLLVPVPLHSERLHERGFNQAAHLARAAAGWLGCPCAPALLERRRATQPQTSLERVARRPNVVGAFAPSAGAAGWLRRHAPRARRVALVDDVLTTGATMSAAAAALQGFETWSCWALAQPVSTFFTTAPLSP